jgi:hypothetical protein
MLAGVFCLAMIAGLIGAFVPYDSVPTLYEFRTYAAFPTRADLARPTLIPSKLTSFFGDNFGGRKLLVREFFRFRLRMLQSDVGLPLVIGTNGWLLDAGEVGTFRSSSSMMSPEKVERMRVVLNSWCSYAKARGAVLVFVVGPNKTTIYPAVPNYLPKKSGPSIIDRMNELKTECPFINVDVRPILRANAHQLLYYKWGTHWNGTAAMLAWREIKSAVAQRGRQLKWPQSVVTVTERPAQPWEDSMWQWFGLPDPEELSIPTPNYLDPKYDPQDTAERAKILAFGDSYLAWMRPAFNEVAGTYSDWSFRPWQKVEYNEDDLRKDAWIVAVVPKWRSLELMNAFKPNIVIVAVVERAVDQLADMPLPPSGGE